jgi:hypothetical protein
MDATFTDTARAEMVSTKSTLWGLLTWSLALVGALADGARGDSLDRLLTTSSSAQFAALPPRQQDRLLDRGFGPLREGVTFRCPKRPLRTQR